MSLPQHLLTGAIPDDQDLATAVQAITKTHPDITPTITRLLAYIQAKHTNSATASTKQPQGIAQFFKPATSTNTTPTKAPSKITGAASAVDAPIGPAIYSTNPVSFLHPIRKKLALSLHKSHIALVTTPSANPSPTDVVFKAPYEALYRVVAVPFLERATKNTALILFFRHSAFASGGGGGGKDAIWAVPLPDDGKDFSLQAYAPNLGLVGLSQDLRITTTKGQSPPLAFVNPPTVTGPTKRPDHILLSILSYFLQHNDTNKTSNSSVMDRIIPNPTPAYPHFSAHLKSNQGTIYLLPTGILFAFRKPVLFLRAAAIEAVGIHAVLSRTFDFEIVMDTTTSSSTSGENSNGKDESVRGATVEDLEGVPESKDGRRAIAFGMVDTKEFARMEEWIKKAGIRDRSMSEDLKAKDKAPTTGAGTGAGGVGKKRERAADGEEEEEGAEGVVQKAAKGDDGGDMDDDDDEDDDDFAPESDDELMEEYDSNAEGSDSDGVEVVEEVQRGRKGGDKKGKGSGGAARKVGGEKKTKKSHKEEEDVDLDEESLGEDSDEDDEDEDEED
ncbi:MAG: histone chaperone Rttp106-like-domain-containing protein [Linnemannia gamsii]|nr:MAG: histone chaperone Rttp106-like-domain-containing protein [Linnemannia gamsii]